VKISEIREKNATELKKNLIELKNKAIKLKFDVSAKQVKNHRDFRKIKKDIAMILTFIAAKEKNTK